MGALVLSPRASDRSILALRAGRGVLMGGGTVLDALLEAITTLEDWPAFNAGYGAVLNAEGYVKLDALTPTS